MTRRARATLSGSEIGYCLAAGCLAVAWVISGWFPAILALWALTFPLGYLASLPIGLAAGVVDIVLGIGIESPAATAVAAVVGVAGYTAVAVANIAVLRWVRGCLRTRRQGLANHIA